MAPELDAIHTVERAVEVGSLDAVIPPARLRPTVIAVLDRALEKTAAPDPPHADRPAWVSWPGVGGEGGRARTVAFERPARGSDAARPHGDTRSTRGALSVGGSPGTKPVTGCSSRGACQRL